MSSYITTSSKIHFTPVSPDPEQIVIRDIAHALSLMTRANGHFPEFYSVGQHCIHCYEEAVARKYSPFLCKACLLHDASEAYLADITRPVKQFLPGYLEIEKRLQDTIYEKFWGVFRQRRNRPQFLLWTTHFYIMNLIITWEKSYRKSRQSYIQRPFSSKKRFRRLKRSTYFFHKVDKFL